MLAQEEVEARSDSTTRRYIARQQWVAGKEVPWTFAAVVCCVDPPSHRAKSPAGASAVRFRAHSDAPNLPADHFSH